MSDYQLVVWPVDELTRVFPRDTPPRDAARLTRAGWRLWAARGEYVTLHLAVAGVPKLEDVVVTLEDLRSEGSNPRSSAKTSSPRGGGIIAGASARVRWVGLVPVPLDAFDCIGAERPDDSPGWYPDPLIESPPWVSPARASPDAPAARRSAGIHISFLVPRDAAAGEYRGSVVVRFAGKDAARVPVRLNVWPIAIPRSPRFHVTNWFHLDCLTKHHRCDAWSERHWRLIELYGRDMAEHRMNVISTPTLMGNFHNSDPMTLVDATHKRDGSWQFNMKRLERWVEMFDRLGFDLFEMWHFASQGHGDTAPPFSFIKESTGRRVWHRNLRTDSGPYRKLLAAFLQHLSAWLDRRKLTDRFLLHVFDEPLKEDWARYVELDRFFRKHARNIRHVDAISSSELITRHGARLEFPVPLTYHLWDADGYYKRRAAEGHEAVWWYTCSGPTGRFANRFVCAPLIHTRMLHWQSFAFNVTGYLHWGHNYWHRGGQDESGLPGINGYADQILLNPMREHPPNWPVGDAAIIYPHPRWWEDHAPLGSLRWEAMRSGLQDWELMRSLGDAVTSHGNSAKGNRSRAWLTRATRVLESVRGPIAGDLRNYCRDSSQLLATRREVGDCLAASPDHSP